MKGVNTFHRLGGSRQVTPAQQGHESGTNVCSRGHQAQPRTAPAGHLPAPPRASRTPAPGLREASCPRALSAAEGWDPRGPGRNEQGIREAGPYWKRFLSRPGRPAGRRQPALRREAGGVAGMAATPHPMPTKGQGTPLGGPGVPQAERRPLQLPEKTCFRVGHTVSQNDIRTSERQPWKVGEPGRHLQDLEGKVIPGPAGGQAVSQTR
ncbi:synapsin-1-like isoform X2 [Suricata suricatta]|uniref:synapsin-1-like isoform X2 n=1 Tax=Suricata suricatta TaxID=37032 RepID=UPI0011558435|nr:synapsin-1-like isoform X2 [Suricata suricatta]